MRLPGQHHILGSDADSPADDTIVFQHTLRLVPNGMGKVHFRINTGAYAAGSCRESITEPGDRIQRLIADPRHPVFFMYLGAFRTGSFPDLYLHTL